ncbi:septal ring factor EnvC (AmiA/AmiB activator) [Roseinatronobacter thiooxidans]|uniref:Septal ring factor EnvC (AmiA/AmiB activator) n=1 Tax=Roseinatronobacter thiooxidans TaxID=121821 RepID=A0A2W7QL17_9RHOB|nr:peptidoglycan DD-metalloendopeptidase family protein [Roseinatronobacter thiooxidans]PZX41939.1 septal ring factor EnvC (AmiA/AmiB activator) [Roseinatronobacter thiooxidans]
MIRRGLAALVCVLWSGAAMADVADRALTAARALEAATAAMQAATGGRDQISALGQTIQAYEDGLVALRDGLRDAQLREGALQRAFAARSEELSRLLSVLMATERVDETVALLHPQGGLETARAAMLLGELTPPLARAVTELRDELDDLRALRRARQYGFLALEQGLEGAQNARVALAQAVAERGPLPKRLVEEPEQLDFLARNAATLEEFAQELAQSSAVSDNQTAATFQTAKGTLSPPVRATILHRFNQPDAAGIVRQGLVLATAPDALVTAPWSATVRYAGPLAGQGAVVILEPAEAVLLVLAGLESLLVSTGEILPLGAPLGSMPSGHSPEITTGSRSQTLYFELREGGNPIDPEPWFAFSGG